jgi:hypothetical protein
MVSKSVVSRKREVGRRSTSLPSNLVVLLVIGCGAPTVSSMPPATGAEREVRARHSTSALGRREPLKRAEIVDTADPAQPSSWARGIQSADSDAVRWAIVATHHHGVMLGMRLTEVWLWPEPFAETDVSRVTARYRDAVTQPPKWRSEASWFEWDGDRWWINVVGHSLFGSELYLAARRCGFNPAIAVASAAVGSAVWEYGYEASGVRPSALDLVYTPLSGLALGELRHWLYHEVDGLSGGPVKTLVHVLMDPLGTLERGLGSPC